MNRQTFIRFGPIANSAAAISLVSAYKTLIPPACQREEEERLARKRRKIRARVPPDRKDRRRSRFRARASALSLWCARDFSPMVRALFCAMSVISIDEAIRGAQSSREFTPNRSFLFLYEAKTHFLFYENDFFFSTRRCRSATISARL